MVCHMLILDDTLRRWVLENKAMAEDTDPSTLLYPEGMFPDLHGMSGILESWYCHCLTGTNCIGYTAVTESWYDALVVVVVATRTVPGLGLPMVAVFPHVNADDILVHSCDIMFEALIDNSHRMNCSTVATVDVYRHEMCNVTEHHGE